MRVKRKGTERVKEIRRYIVELFALSPNHLGRSLTKELGSVLRPEQLYFTTRLACIGSLGGRIPYSIKESALHYSFFTAKGTRKHPYLCITALSQ